jgi:hypothetical protein
VVLFPLLRRESEGRSENGETEEAAKPVDGAKK